MSRGEGEAVIIERSRFNREVFFNKLNFKLSLHQALSPTKITISESHSMFFFLQNGSATISTNSFNADVSTGMYAGLQGKSSINCNAESVAITIEIENLSLLNALGGPIEKIGRLKYIDGCSDTLLIAPSKLGEPCLNFLHFPENTKQTVHHHPSFRFGIILSGEGYCESNGVIKQLTPGDVFFIPALVKHSFNTEKNCLNIIAFHPDSDWGPTDEIHPMINKTIL